jgi:hypothetical protein
VETWLFEGPAPNVFRKLNARKSDFESAAGKAVTVEASRARDGSRSGLIRIITLPYGEGCIVMSAKLLKRRVRRCAKEGST